MSPKWPRRTDQPDSSSTNSSTLPQSSSIRTALTDISLTSTSTNLEDTPDSTNNVFPFLKTSSLSKLTTVWEKHQPPRAAAAVAVAAAAAAGATARNIAPAAVASVRAWKKLFQGLRNLRDLCFDDFIQAAESGNVDDFARLWLEDPNRLGVQDGRGRTAAHQASARNQVQILQFISARGGDLNIKDNVGNTPLHVAILENALEAVEYLLASGVNTSILNEKHQAAIHLATERNRVAVLKTMGRYPDRIDSSLGGEHGRTALHLAAIYDHDECARVLVEHFSACALKPCANGYYPIHEAAKNASSRTMEVILQWGESKGCYTREAMISLFDAEGNVPLHSAVHGGDIRAVELCLRSGARISTQQHDLSTPVHLACAQGAGDIVELMFNLQPAEKTRCLRSCDAQRMTPMHCAAMFDHPEIVEFLRKEGADIDPLDKEKRSPLLLAASRSAWRTVNVLIRLGADMYLADSNTRNVLHLLVMNGGRLDDLDEFTAAVANKRLALERLLNERDATGCSPMHYASREGHIRSLENLIRLGACINLKNNNNESPLHFAARYGRYNTVRQLLDSEKGTFIINEGDGEGLTPLHIASQQGHTRVVQLLLNRGALLHRDHNGRTPLHLAAMSGFTQTMELLQSVHSHLLDQVDKDGNTALHLATMENKPNSISLLLSMNCQLLYNSKDMSAIDYAIYYKYPDAALAMVTHDERAQEVLEMKSDKYPCVTLALIASMPRVFESVQDKCIVKANCKKDSKSFYIKYNFGCLSRPMRAIPDTRIVEPRNGLLPASNTEPLPALNIKYSFRPYEISADKLAARRQESANPKWRPPPLLVINAMVVHGRVELLAHPLSQKYLQMKWHSYGKYFHLANLLLYSIFLIFVTTFSASLMDYLCSLESIESCFGKDSFNHTHQPIASHQTLNHQSVSGFNGSPVMYVCSVVILIYVASNALREIYQFYQQRCTYMVDPSNLVTWLLYFNATATVLPLFFGRLETLQISTASATVFLAWFNLLLFLQRFDRVGIYVVMFLEILQTLIKVLLIFSILIIAFGLAFYILLSRGNHLPFRSAPMSLLRTFSMMLGEIDVLGTFVQPFYRTGSESLSLPYPFPAFIILGIFMVVMPILLMNLLIGLAVGDIESVRRNAQLKRLAMQVVLHTELERKLPHFLLDRVDRMELIEYPNDSNCGKLGFIDTLLRKWFCNPFTDDESGSDIPQETSEDFLAEELLKAKQRLKEMSASLESQHLLLRLIVQKMEIKTEADDVDEGAPPKPVGAVCRWKAPRLRNRLRAARAFRKSPSV